MITIPTIDELKEQILDDIEAADTSTTLLPRAVWRILAAAMAGIQYLCYKLGLWLYNQIFTVSMDEEALIKRAAEYGLARTPAIIWMGTGTATGTDGTIIAAGTLCTYGDYAYEAVSTVTISAGIATISLRSLEAGEDINLDDATELEWSTPQSGLDSVVTIASTTQSGEDIEPLTAFRNRVLLRQQLQTQAGTAAWWAALALEVAGISEAFAFNTSPGVVSVYPLTDETDPADRIPDTAKLAEVMAYINDTSRRQFVASVNTVAFTELTFNVTISGMSPDTTAMRTLIEAAIEDYLYERRPKQYDDEVNPKDVVSAAELTSLVIAAGAQTAVITLQYDSSTITSRELDYYELAKLGSLIWI